MKWRPLSRRTLLRGMGGVAIGLPFLEAMEARAQATTPTRRFVFWFTGNGTIPSRWTATQGTDGLTLPADSLLKPLEAVRTKANVLYNVDLASSVPGPGEGHARGMGSLLTGNQLAEGTQFSVPGPDGTVSSAWASSISVDQEMAKRVGAGRKFPSLEFGVRVTENSVWSRISYLGKNQPVPPVIDPKAMFARVFGDGNLGTTDVARLLSRRKTVLDSVLADYKSLQARLGTTDRQRIDAHVTGIREIERRISATPSMPTTCTAPAAPPSLNVTDNPNVPALGKLQMDLLAMALACDLTRVATFQWAQHGGGFNTSFPWLGVSEDHHTLGHAPDSDTASMDKLFKIELWYMQQLAYLATKLQSIPDGSSTLLDNTVLLSGSELGKANDHRRTGIPFVMVGSCGGYFRMGRVIRSGSGTSHNNLLVSMLNAMGVATNTFGNPALCTGPLSGLT